ncbi:fibropellin-3-like [Dreissena polymorpha]|uniref:fibropellin-3-like n=1 Tax=Dreissena polymorpha TaxID=45954 RepID=UPI0022647149|nr:fibropellin-3-like [Dreissena polymorpha]
MAAAHVLLFIVLFNLIWLLNAATDNDTGPCLNNATCQNSYFGFQSCVCKPGFVGYRCEYGILSCSADICQNGGNCTTYSTGAIRCECSAEYWGRFCEYGIETCPCHNNATCQNEQVCVCKPGFTSSDCSNRIVDCSANPCQNGASCTQPSYLIDGISNFTCICSHGYWGQFCENEILQDCTSNPCAHNASCEDISQYMTSAPFKCHCQVGFYGEKCEYEHNYCSANSCANGATCQNTTESNYCRCIGGFYGTRCEYVSVNCSSNPCENEAT